MRPECTPLMFASQIDAAWYLGKALCRDYPHNAPEIQDATEALVNTLVAIFGEDRRFVELTDILMCAKRFAGAMDADDSFSAKKAAE
jgi:hypothetical protein